MKSNRTEKNNTKMFNESNIIIPEKFINHKLNLLNVLDCLDEKVFKIHIYKNFDEKHKILEIKNEEIFEKLKVEEWISDSILPSIQSFDLSHFKQIYHNEIPALIYINSPFTNRIVSLKDKEKINNSIYNTEKYKIFFEKSLNERKNFLFFITNENNHSTQLLTDLLNLKTEELPALVGLKSNSKNEVITKKKITKNSNLEEYKKFIDDFIICFKDNEKDLEKDKENIYYSEDDNFINPIYKSENENKCEIYKITRNNYKKEILEREEEGVFILFPYKGNLRPEVKFFSLIKLMF